MIVCLSANVLWKFNTAWTATIASRVSKIDRLLSVSSQVCSINGQSGWNYEWYIVLLLEGSLNGFIGENQIKENFKNRHFFVWAEYWPIKWVTLIKLMSNRSIQFEGKTILLCNLTGSDCCFISAITLKTTLCIYVHISLAIIYVLHSCMLFRQILQHISVKFSCLHSLQVIGF